MESPLMDKLVQGNPPGTPEDWQELAVFMSNVSNFLHVVNDELDTVEFGMAMVEKLIEVLADAATPQTRLLMKGVVESGYENRGLHVSEVQDQNGSQGDVGPSE